MAVMEKLFGLQSKRVTDAGELIDAAILDVSEGKEGPPPAKLLAALDAAGWTPEDFRHAVETRKQRIAWAAVLERQDDIHRQQFETDEAQRKAEAELLEARKKFAEQSRAITIRRAELAAESSACDTARQNLVKTARTGIDRELQELREQLSPILERVDSVREQLKLVPGNVRVLENNIRIRTGKNAAELNSSDQATIRNMRREESRLRDELRSLQEQLGEIHASQARLELEKLIP